MALIITAGVSANEPSLGGHLLSLFQFPRGEYREGGAGTGRLYFFPCFAVINYGMAETQACLLVVQGAHSETLWEPAKPPNQTAFLIPDSA